MKMRQTSGLCGPTSRSRGLKEESRFFFQKKLGRRFQVAARVLPAPGQRMPAAALNYYDILEIKRSVTPAGIKQAFRKLALKWHPERAADKAHAEKMFPLVCEAYDVLAHPARREIFDQYGENGLKSGTPDGAGGVTGGRYTFAVKPEDVYSQFFGTASPFSDLLGPMNGSSPEFYGELTGMTMIKQPVKPEPLVIEMPVTLRDIYNGTAKRLTYTRRALLFDKTTTEKVEAINLLVGPGWEDGTVATYPAAGDEGVDCETADVQVNSAPLFWAALSSGANTYHNCVFQHRAQPSTLAARMRDLPCLYVSGAHGDEAGGTVEPRRKHLVLHCHHHPA
jgi:curved DNA-binding protein CbpA